MAVRRDSDGRWRYRKVVRLPDRSRKRISGTPTINTKQAALDAERAEIEEELRKFYEPQKKEVPKFDEWFNGRFWREWVVARKNSASEIESKRSIFKNHLKERFGRLRLDQIDDEIVAQFRADLVERKRKLAEKSINNILAVLSKPLHYAKRVKLIQSVPDMGILKKERPEIVAWELEEYANLLAATKSRNKVWYAVACLAGEAGLRIGEVKALDWKRDVDMVGKTITVNQQTRHGHTGSPKGRTRRTIPMTDTLVEALRGLDELRVGYVIRNLDGTAKADNQIKNVSYRLCRWAKLPERGWHILRHAFATHAARFGVNPWTLMMWLGHKRIDETMRYVDLAHLKPRPIPEHILQAGAGEQDPDVRVIKMLGARGKTVAKVEGAGTGEK